MKIVNIAILAVFSLLAETTLCQDSTAQKKNYQSYGFQASPVSGSGISYGQTINNYLRYRISGGALSSGSDLNFSIGGDVHFILTKETRYSLFIGGSVGVSGSSAEAPKPRISYSTGIEIPISASRVGNGLSTGIIIYYPAYFINSSQLKLMFGVFIYYNY
jgi:hypothetical protein